MHCLPRAQYIYSSASSEQINRCAQPILFPLRLCVNKGCKSLKISHPNSERMSSLNLFICVIYTLVKILLLSATLPPDRYHPLSSHQQWLYDFSKNHQNVKLEEIGRSFEGRPLLLMKICHNRKCGHKPVYWIDAGIHAREWIGPAVLPYFTEVKKIILQVG